VRLADAVTVFLGTIPGGETRAAATAVVLNRLVADFGARTPMWRCWIRSRIVLGGWFTFVVGQQGGHGRSTSGWRRSGRRASTGREQTWLIGDPLVRLRARPRAAGH